jgi:hypothetical protein
MSTFITRLYSSESFMLNIASSASSADSNSMYANPRIELSKILITDFQHRGRRSTIFVERDLNVDYFAKGDEGC